MPNRFRKAAKASAHFGAIPAFAWMTFFLAIPLVYILVISFMKNGEEWGIVPSFTLENYARIADPLYVGIFASSFAAAAGATILAFAFGYPFAWITAKLGKRTRTVILMLLMIPFWTNTIIRTYGWIIFLQKRGVLNGFLVSAGILAKPAQFLYTDGAVILGIVYTMLPFMILPIYNSVEKMDRSLIEAARDLGASPKIAFFSVGFPQTLPGVISGCLLVFIPSIGIFYITDLLGGANAVLLGNLIRNQFVEARNWPFGSALAVVMGVLALILIRLYRKALGGKNVEFAI